MKKLLLLVSLLSLSAVTFADITPQTQIVANQVHAEHVVWDRVPISFAVPVGQERMITFPGTVDVRNNNPKLTTDLISILNNNGTLYIKAKNPFDAIRVPVVMSQTGEVILVDLSAAPNADDSPVDVVLAKKDAAISDGGSQPMQKPISYTDLTRFAVQTLYSPERLIESNPRINRAPMYTTKSVNLVYGGNVIAMPLASWRGGDYFVTAVLLKNIWSQTIKVDPRMLKGSWLAASFYPTNYVTKEGSLHDRTTLFLVSNAPFNNALNSMQEYSND